MNGILTFEHLRAITKLERAGDVTRCLRNQGIAVFYGKGGEPWTTLDLINHAGGIALGKSANDEPYGPEICP